MEYIEILKIGGPIAVVMFIFGVVIIKIVRMFMEVITNHLKHDAELHEKTIGAVNELEKTQQNSINAQRQLAGVIKELLGFLQRNNK